MGSQDILQVIPDEKLPELKAVLKQNYPESIHVYNFVDTTMQVKRAHPNENIIVIYAPEGDFSDGTIVATIDMYCYDILIFTLDKSLKRLERAIRETKNIDWDKNPLFCAMHEDYYEMMFKVRNEIGHPFPNDVPSYVWWLPKEKALQYDCSIPDEIFAAPLNETHALIMNEVWPHRSPGSEKFLGKLLELNGGIGLFLKSNNELCAWVLKNYFGGLGILQTANKHKRKGYGSLITKIFSKMIAEQDGNDVSGFIVRKNGASQNMFSKLDFKQVTPVTWLENKQYELEF